MSLLVRVAAATGALAGLAIVLTVRPFSTARPSPTVGAVTVYHPTMLDESPPLATLGVPSAAGGVRIAACGPPDNACGTAPPPDPDVRSSGGAVHGAAVAPGAEIEQRQEGDRASLPVLSAFDGLGADFEGPAGTVNVRNPSDNSLAVGPDHIVQIVNSVMAVYTRAGAMFDTTGQVLYGPVETNAIFKGFGGTCEKSRSADAVVRYDQLAGRWLYVLPIFRKLAGDSTFAMCYAVSAGSDPLGPYYRYEFRRPLFPDYPRPAVWPDGYYIPTSTGDNVVQKHACVADRARMLRGLPATEQCVIIDGVNFLNNADVDGYNLPPAGAPNIIMAAGGTQLKKIFEDNALYAWTFHVDWNDSSKTLVRGPIRIPVAPYHYLCDGQLSNCVPQPDTNVRLDAQGDKLMQRLVYRNLGRYRSIVAVHSVNTSAGGGGVRWYEFRVDAQSRPQLFQQSTFAPDSFYRWMASIAIDHLGDIGMGYSFGGTPNYPGQRFTARLAADSLGRMTYHESVLARGEGSQLRGNRWEDYTTTAMDPSDDCTFWYVGDYYRTSGTRYSTRIGAFRLPACRGRIVTGTLYLDVNHNGSEDPGEPGIPDREIRTRGVLDTTMTTNEAGRFALWVRVDSATTNPVLEVSAPGSNGDGLKPSGPGGERAVPVADRRSQAELHFGSVCTTRNSGGRSVDFWSGHEGAAVLAQHDSLWRAVLATAAPAINTDGTAFMASDTGAAGAVELARWLHQADDHNMSTAASAELVATALGLALGSQDGRVTVADPVQHDWPTVASLASRVSAFLAEHHQTDVKGPDRDIARAYRDLLHDLNRNAEKVTPVDVAGCEG
jgi:hypothetical protein